MLIKVMEWEDYKHLCYLYKENPLIWIMTFPKWLFYRILKLDKLWFLIFGFILGGIITYWILYANGFIYKPNLEEIIFLN